MKISESPPSIHMNAIFVLSALIDGDPSYAPLFVSWVKPLPSEFWGPPHSGRHSIISVEIQGQVFTLLKKFSTFVDSAST